MKDLTGEKFGRWTVLSFSRMEKISPKCYRYYWKCRCQCGTEKEVLVNSLRSGRSLSCGCLCKELHPRKHNMSNTRLFWIWHAMVDRCNNPKLKSYRLYGARGIKVCEDWKESTNFIEWALNNGYKDNLTLDRIDFNGNYEPSNCRWVDWKVQANNTSRNHYLEINGETKTLAQWAEFYKVPYKYVHKRVRDLGWTYEDAVSRPVRKCERRNKING